MMPDISIGRVSKRLLFEGLLEESSYLSAIYS